MGVTKDFRKEKMRELKATIKLAQADLKAYNSVYKESREATPNIEEKPVEHAAHMELLKEQATILGQKSSVLEALVEELQNTKLNKRSSKFFEWMPSPPNRRMRRAMRRV